MGNLKVMAAEGNRRRNQARMTVTVLFLVALLQIASTVVLGGFVISWRHQDHAQSQRQAADAALRAKRTEDLYAKENDTNNVVRALAGQPPAPPIVPPPVATSTTTTTTTTVPRSITAPAASPGRSPSTTGPQPSPPATGAPAPSQPPAPTTTVAPLLCRLPVTIPKGCP